MSKDFKIGINRETERGKEFMKVFGSDVVFVKSPIPKYILKPDKEKVLAYFLDIDLLTKKQRIKLIAHLSKKFDQPIDSVKKDLDTIGVPILKEDCIVIIENPQRWF